MSGRVTLYISNIASSSEVKKQQQFIQDILIGSKIDFDLVDVAANREDLLKMRDIVGKADALAPQIANGEEYCGDYSAFEEAVEDKILKQFLKLE